MVVVLNMNAPAAGEITDNEGSPALSQAILHFNLRRQVGAAGSGSRVSGVVAQLREAIFEKRLRYGMGLEHAGLVTRKSNLGTTRMRLSHEDVGRSYPPWWWNTKL